MSSIFLGLVPVQFPCFLYETKFDNVGVWRVYYTGTRHICVNHYRLWGICVTALAWCSCVNIFENKLVRQFLETVLNNSRVKHHFWTLYIVVHELFCGLLEHSRGWQAWKTFSWHPWEAIVVNILGDCAMQCESRHAVKHRNGGGWHSIAPQRL